MTDREQREKVIEILEKEKKTALHDNRWAFDYAISSIKTDLKYNLLYEGEDIYTKADMVAMLTEIQTEIEERLEDDYSRLDEVKRALRAERVMENVECGQIIQQKIDKLRGEVEE